MPASSLAASPLAAPPVADDEVVRPRLRGEVVARVVATGGGQSAYVLKQPRTGTYVRLQPAEYFLVERMDGMHTAADLALAYLLEYRCFALERVLHVIAELRRYGFLDEPTSQARDGLAPPSRPGWVARIDQHLRGLLFREVVLDGLDGAVSGLYRTVGWLAFTRPGLLLVVLLAILGTALPAWELLHPANEAVRLGGSYTLEVLSLLGLWVLAVSVHEAGHALATKHYGCQVARGGLMLYYGLPALFVDTSDIWLAPRRGRLVVALAGLVGGSAVGGLSLLGALLLPDTGLAAVVHQFALASFFANLFNLLPLLELDGYYLLVDLLEMPLLRPRALAFVRGPLWQKLRHGIRLSREERILAVFGLLATVYSVYAVGLALRFWTTRLLGLLTEAWSSEVVWIRLLVGLLALVLSAPLALGLGLRLATLADAARHRLAARVPPHEQPAATAKPTGAD